MSLDLLTIGSCTLDCIIKIKDILRFELLSNDEVKKYTAIEYSKKLNIENVRFFPGGSAANIASDCAMMNIKSSYIGMIGTDFSAKMCLDDMKSRGVNISHVNQTEKDKTAFSVILKTNWGKDRSILAYKGANDLISPTDINEDLFKKIQAFAWTSLTKENSCKAVDKCIDLTKENGGKVFAAPSMSIIKNNEKWAEKLISKSDVLSLNKEEAQAFTNIEETVHIIKELMDKSLDLVSITNGSNGSVLSDGKNIINNGVYDISIKDMTGAGDAFMSGIIFSHLNNYDLEKTSKFASAIASFEAMKTGVREGIPKDLNKINKFIEENTLEQVISELK
ncbi:MAG: carbohydrate kinase family protein [Promethearchaeati archaeon]